GAFGYHPILEFRQVFGTVLIAATSIIWYQYEFVGFRAIFGVFGVIAPISYAMYIFQYPVLLVILSVPWLTSPLIAFVTALSIVLGASYLLEAKLQRRVTFVVNRLLLGEKTAIGVREQAALCSSTTA